MMLMDIALWIKSCGFYYQIQKTLFYDAMISLQQIYRVEQMMNLRLISKYTINSAVAISLGLLGGCGENAKSTLNPSLKAIKSNPQLQVNKPAFISHLKSIHKNISKPAYKEFFQKNHLKSLNTSSKKATSGGFSVKSGTTINTFYEDFSSANNEFGDGSDGWFEWGGDYFPSSENQNALTLQNPPNKPPVLQTGFYKTIPVTGQAGDTIIAKMKVATTFSAESDTTLVLIFNDSAQTVLVTDTARGSLAGDQTLFVQGIIPSGATTLTIAPLVYLHQDETSSLLIKNIPVEQIPEAHYTKRTLAHNHLDFKGFAQFGSNSPGLEEFGYDFYSVDGWPLKYSVNTSANQWSDRATTVYNPGAGSHNSPEGGLIQRVNLSHIESGDSLTAMLYAAPTFTDPNSFTTFSLQYFDSNDQLLQSVQSDTLKGNNYKWLVLDRIPVPAGAKYVKLIPTVKLGANETSSLLWDELHLYHYGFNASTPDYMFCCNATNCEDNTRPMFGGSIGNTNGIARPFGSADAEGFASVNNGVDGDPVSYIKQISTEQGPQFMVVNSSGNEITIEDSNIVNGSPLLQSTPRYKVKHDGIIYDSLVHSTEGGTGQWQIANPNNPLGYPGLGSGIIPSGGLTSEHYARPVGKVSFSTTL